jgi:hypothetical protein
VAAGQGAQREHGRRQWAGDRAGDQGGRGCHQVAAGRSRSCSRSSAGAVTTSALRRCWPGCGPGSRSVGRPAAPGSSPPARFRPWATVAWPAWTARAAASASVGSDLPRRRRAWPSGRLSSTTTWPGSGPGRRRRSRCLPRPRRWLAEPAGPGEQVLIAGGGGGDAAGADAAAELVAGVGEVAVQVGVDPDGDRLGRSGRGHAGDGRLRSVAGQGWPARRPGGQPGDRSGRQAPIRSPSSGWRAQGWPRPEPTGRLQATRPVGGGVRLSPRPPPQDHHSGGRTRRPPQEPPASRSRQRRRPTYRVWSPQAHLDPVQRT